MTRWTRIAPFLLALTPLLAQDSALFTSAYPLEEFSARRKAVYDAIGDKAVALIQGAPAPAGFTRFRQSNDFYYLCGVEVPQAYLLLDGRSKRATLYLTRQEPRAAAWEGKRLNANLPADAQKLTGVEMVKGLDRLAADLAGFGWSRPELTLFTPMAPAEGAAVSRDVAWQSLGEAYSDPFDGRPSREGRLIGLLRERYPQFAIQNLTPVLDRLRVIKSPAEIKQIERATRLAGEAIREAMRSTAPGTAEFELDAVAKFIFFRNGAQAEAYESLIASGPNAMLPHYSANSRRMQAGEMVLMDFAPDVAYRMSDVTRIWPVDGHFSPVQRELYGFYLACYREMLASFKPGVSLKQSQRESGEKMERILAATKFSKPIYEKAAKGLISFWKDSRYEAIGHWVGMATHEAGPAMDVLAPGMVFTLEPPMTVPEERIYLRAEDLILITADGSRSLSAFVPLSMDEIEAEMKMPGLLKSYPKVD
jgi:Xaa-Pro aminopeptidase